MQHELDVSSGVVSYVNLSFSVQVVTDVLIIAMLVIMMCNVPGAVMTCGTPHPSIIVLFRDTIGVEKNSSRSNTVETVSREWTKIAC